MFKYLITLLFAVSSVQAEAKIDAEDIFFGIIGGIILGKIIEKQNKNEDSWTNSDKLILKDTGNQLVMANLALPAHGGSDSVRFPECNKNTRNRRVDALRFRVDNADAFVRSVQITYQNNQQERVSVNRVFRNKTASDWYEVAGGNRCVKQIRVEGEGLISGKNNRRSLMTFVGFKSTASLWGGSF